MFEECFFLSRSFLIAPIEAELHSFKFHFILFAFVKTGSCQWWKMTLILESSFSSHAILPFKKQEERKIPNWILCTNSVWVIGSFQLVYLKIAKTVKNEMRRWGEWDDEQKPKIPCAARITHSDSSKHRFGDFRLVFV